MSKTDREARFLEDQRKTAEQEAKVYDILKPVIDRYDPEQLLKMGCPSDEYESTCKRIAKEIVRERSNRLSVEELGNLLGLAWHMEFGMWGQKVIYPAIFYTIAEELKPLLPAPYRYHSVSE